jgi:hypothetical protein
MNGGNGKQQVKIILCAGQNCADRESCARFCVRGGEFPWASFDIERQGREEPCPAQIVIRHARQRRK